MAEKLSSLLVFTVTTFGMFIYLVSIMPAELQVTDFSMIQQDIPEFFEALDIETFSEYEIVSINNTNIKAEIGDYLIKGFNIGGHTLSVSFSKANMSHHRMWVTHYWSEWIIWGKTWHLWWYNEEGQRVTTDPNNWITAEQIDQDMTVTADQAWATYTLKEIRGGTLRLELSVSIGYDPQKYSNTSDAWNHYDLHILERIGFDQISTTYNAWNLIGQLLLFQAPDIHPLINFIIALPFWTVIVYVVYRLILLAIPFVGGGA